MFKYSSNSDTSYCLGMSLTIEALKHIPNHLINVVLSSKANNNDQLDYLISLCKDNNVEIIYDDRIIESLSLKDNCYCIGFFKKYNNELLGKNHIVLYQFNDYGELGTVLRSSVSFNYRDIILIDSEIDYFDPRCVRASVGSIFLTNIKRYSSMIDYLEEYPDNFIYPFVPNGGHDFETMKVYEPFSIIIPQAYRGLYKEFKEGYYLKLKDKKGISLSSLSAIVISNVYHQIVSDKNI